MISLKNEFDLRPKTIAKDFLSGTIVFLVALPLCLGIAKASGASEMSGLIAGIVGGIVIGFFSGSHTSVSGPAAGLTVIVFAQIQQLGEFETFLLAVVLSGVIQIVFGLIKAGALSAFFPSSVIKGLLAAIGVILILKQLPFLFGYGKSTDMAIEAGLDPDPDHKGEHKNSLLEFYDTMLEVVTQDIQYGAAAIGIIALIFLIVWDRIEVLRKSLVPAPLVVVLLSVGLSLLFSHFLTGSWVLNPKQLVNVPVANSPQEFASFFKFPDFSQLGNSAVYLAAFTIAVVSSLETLLNLDAVDKLDRRQRVSPPNRELFAQGVGNMTAGLIGGIPVTSVVIRGSVNVLAGSESKLSAIFHGLLLLACVALVPSVLNLIPVSCLAAILLLTGYKLASPKLMKQMWQEGRYQLMPFLITLVAIVMSDLLIGILIGLATSLLFILHSNLKRPVRVIREKHIDGDLLHIELPNQVSFLNRASLEQALRSAPRGSRVMLDARRTNYMDPDIKSLFRDFKKLTAPVYEIDLQLVGFDKEQLPFFEDSVDFSKRELRDDLTAADVLEILAEGNRRYVEGHPLDRDMRKQMQADSYPHPPLAAIFTGIDSNVPVEQIFDLGLGEAFVIRTPGTAIGDRAIGGLEYAYWKGGVKLIVILAYVDSTLLQLAVDNLAHPEQTAVKTGCNKLEDVLEGLSRAIDKTRARRVDSMDAAEKQAFFHEIAKKNATLTVKALSEESPALRNAVEAGRLGIVAAMVDVQTGTVVFMADTACGFSIPTAAGS
jgi:carbonic anhydrase